MLDPVTTKNLAQIRQNEMLQNAYNTRRLKRSTVINMGALLTYIGTMLVNIGQKMKTQQRPVVKKAA